MLNATYSPLLAALLNFASPLQPTFAHCQALRKEASEKDLQGR